MSATAVNRLLAYKRQVLILKLLENNQLNISQVSEQICDSFLIIKAEIKKLYLRGYLSRKRIYCPVARKPVFSYKSKNKDFPMPNIKATDEQKKATDCIDLINDESRKKKSHELPKQLTEHKKVIVDPKNPHITTYLNLGRAGSDYAWQRPKRKHTSVSIGSTFSLYDGATL